MNRKASFYPISWFHDLHARNLLNMDPPYQRKSVWNQTYKDFFIDTILSGYPCPAVFLHEDMSPQGVAKYSVVDGKQRLNTIFEFVRDEFSIPANSTHAQLRDKYFKDLSNDTKKEFWRYQFSVEFVPSEDERLINDIFDRINRNVAKLTRQELRHARFDGEFPKSVDDASEFMLETLPQNFPSIAKRSRRQMKDDELVAQLLLLIESGPKSYSQDSLDEAYSARDVEWAEKADVFAKFRAVITKISDIIAADATGQLARSRLRNQADFYSLVGAVAKLQSENQNIDPNDANARLLAFISKVESEEQRNDDQGASSYFAAARSASNDFGPRTSRINTLVHVLTRPA